MAVDGFVVDFRVSAMCPFDCQRSIMPIYFTSSFCLFSKAIAVLSHVLVPHHDVISR